MDENESIVTAKLNYLLGHVSILSFLN